MQKKEKNENWPTCLYCDKKYNPKGKWAKEVNKNYDEPIFCGPACEADYEDGLDRFIESLIDETNV